MYTTWLKDSQKDVFWKLFPKIITIKIKNKKNKCLLCAILNGFPEDLVHFDASTTVVFKIVQIWICYGHQNVSIWKFLTSVQNASMR